MADLPHLRAQHVRRHSFRARGGRQTRPTAFRTFGESIGAHVIGIDLRWGVQAVDDVGGSQTIVAASKRSNSCRPYFLGFVSGRRGWVPGIADVDAESSRRYPELARCIAEGLSITELEILHALCPLDNRARSGTAALIFSRRDDSAWASEELQEALATRGISASESSDAWDTPLIVHRYERQPIPNTEGKWTLTHGNGTLADAVEQNLCAWLSHNHPRRGDTAFRDVDDRVRALTIGATVPFTGELEWLRSSVKSSLPVVITGTSGVGKTTLLAQFATSLIDAGQRPLYRFFGYSTSPVDLDDLLVPLTAQVERALQLPDGGGEGRRDLLRRWHRAWSAVETAKLNIPLLLDGLDSVPFDPNMLQWLFTPIRQGSPVVVSVATNTERGAALRRTLLASGAMNELPLAGFETADARATLIRNNLAQSLKELDTQSMAVLLQHPMSANPLFVSVVISELKLHGRHDDIAEQLTQRLGTNTESVIEMFLQRLETEDVVGHLAPACRGLLMGALTHSPSGLSTRDITRLLCAVDKTLDQQELTADVEEFLHHLRPFLQRRPHAHAFNSSVFTAMVRARHEVLPESAARAAGTDSWPQLLAEVVGARDEVSVPVKHGPPQSAALLTCLAISATSPLSMQWPNIFATSLKPWNVSNSQAREAFAEIS